MGMIPMIEEGLYRVHGGNYVMFVYLCKSHSSIKAKMMPVDNEQKVKAALGWYYSKMAGVGDNLYNFCYDQGSFGGKTN